jgi:hypothetical protein
LDLSDLGYRLCYYRAHFAPPPCIIDIDYIDIAGPLRSTQMPLITSTRRDYVPFPLVKASGRSRPPAKAVLAQLQNLLPCVILNPEAPIHSGELVL